MADIAAVFHWPPQAMFSLTLSELAEWRELACQRWKEMNQQPGNK